MPERRLISSGSPYEEYIAYSRAVLDGDYLFISGTTDFNCRTMSISDDVIEQAEQCFRNLAQVLEEANSSFDDTLRVRDLFPDNNDFAPCRPVFRKYLGQTKPAATFFAASLLDERMKLEVELMVRMKAE